jgi:hypothetical protein
VLKTAIEEGLIQSTKETERETETVFKITVSVSLSVSIKKAQPNGRAFFEL